METLNETESICPECLRRIPATIITDGAKVFLRKTCPRHGTSQGLIWNHLELYQRACEQRSPNAPIEPVSENSSYYYGLVNRVAKRTCLAILDVTQQCNAGCKVCIADSDRYRNVPPLNTTQIQRVAKILRDEAGNRVPIQLSGGEPTVHKDICSIIEVIRGEGFDSVEMNSNGILLAEKPELAKQLREAGLKGIFLQFDGVSPSVYAKIRGKNILDKKLKAIEACQKVDMPIILQPTIVRGVNDNEMWKIVQFAVNAGIAGVDFLPFTPTGKYPHGEHHPLYDRVTISDVIKGLEEQSEGQVRAEDLYSVPCQDQRCAIIAYVLLRGTQLLPITRIAEYTDVKHHYGNLSNWETILADLNRASSTRDCCGSTGCGRPRYDLRADGYFVIGCHGFQDKWNFDLDRARLCCFHELTAQGKLIPFCYYSITRNQWLCS